MLTPEIVAQSILHTAMLPEQAVVEELTLMPSAGVPSGQPVQTLTNNTYIMTIASANASAGSDSP